MGETSVTKHHSNSPVVKRHLRAAGGGGGGSGDVSPVYSPTVVRKEFDTKKTE